VPGRDLDRISRDWQELGSTDPFWAVYVAPDTRGGKWDLEQFMATGRAEIAKVMTSLSEVGLPVSRKVAVDFGCGVGRLSQPLAAHFDKIISVDVSDAMLAQARELDRTGGRIEFVLNPSNNLSFIPDGSVDLVYSSLVLQHLPRKLAVDYLREFVRILAPGGVAAMQLATRPTLSLKGIAFRVLPHWITGMYQMRVLNYPAPMRMVAMPRRWAMRQIAGAGAVLISAVDDASYGGHWNYTRYLFRPHT
jgi:SAM-dependent methyltransferase